jgi:hypothetical protein
MKRAPKGKRKGRRSPYQAHGKEPYRYSTAYNEWFRQHTGRGKVYNGSSFDR